MVRIFVVRNCFANFFLILYSVTGYLQQAGGQQAASTYPQARGQGKCKADPSKFVTGKPSGTYTGSAESTLASALQVPLVLFADFKMYLSFRFWVHLLTHLGLVARTYCGAALRSEAQVRRPRSL